MKRYSLFFIAFLFLSAFTLPATTVKLKITYKGNGVANSDITIKHGDVALGSGRTDSGGNVSINASNLISRSIDVYGQKTCGGTTKNWDVKGWVTLDDDNFAHLNMDDVVKEMTSMGMSEGMLVSAWGLSASGCNDSGSGSSGKTDSGTSDAGSGSTTSSSSSSETIDWEQMRQDKLDFQRSTLENDIDRLNDRIVKTKAHLNALRDGGEPEVTIRRTEIDLEMDRLKLEDKELELEQVNAKLAGNRLNKTRRNEIQDRQAQIETDLDRLKDEDKKLKRDEKAMKEEENIDSMSKVDVRARLLDLKSSRKKKQLSLKMSGKRMDAEKKAALEAEVAGLDRRIERLEQRLAELTAEEEGGEATEE